MYKKLNTTLASAETTVVSILIGLTCFCTITGCNSKTNLNSDTQELSYLHAPGKIEYNSTLWPDPIVVVDKSGGSTEYDAQQLWDELYLHGWNVCLIKFLGESDLDFGPMCGTGLTQIATQAGKDSCSAKLAELEGKYGREHVQDFIRSAQKNTEYKKR